MFDYVYKISMRNICSSECRLFTHGFMVDGSSICWKWIGCSVTWWLGFGCSFLFLFLPSFVSIISFFLLHPYNYSFYFCFKFCMPSVSDSSFFALFIQVRIEHVLGNGKKSYRVTDSDIKYIELMKVKIKLQKKRPSRISDAEWIRSFSHFASNICIYILLKHL